MAYGDSCEAEECTVFGEVVNLLSSSEETRIHIVNDML